MRSLIGSGCGVGGVASVLIPARRTPSIRAERASDNRSERAGNVIRASDECMSSQEISSTAQGTTFTFTFNREDTQGFRTRAH